MRKFAWDCVSRDIANLIECVAMFYFIKGLSVFRRRSHHLRVTHRTFLFETGAKAVDGEIGATGASVVTEMRIFNKIVDL